MKRIATLLVLALGLFASVAFAQTATVNSLANVTNRAGTYYAAVTGLVLVASPTDSVIITGSATKTIFVKSVKLSCTATTAAQVPVHLYKRTTANTVVSATALTAVKSDSADDAATAAVYTYVSGTAANPTTGTGVIMDTEILSILAPGTAAGGKSLFSREWGTGMDRYLTLRGTAQSLAINFGGVTLAGSLCNVAIAWMER